jgi:hypothetical protein
MIGSKEFSKLKAKLFDFIEDIVVHAISREESDSRDVLLINPSEEAKMRKRPSKD